MLFEVEMLQDLKKGLSRRKNYYTTLSKKYLEEKMIIPQCQRNIHKIIIQLLGGRKRKRKKKVTSSLGEVKSQKKLRSLRENLGSYSVGEVFL